MTQLYTPNLGVRATPGYCLRYVDDAGNAPTRRPSAKAAFEAEQRAGRINGGDSPVGLWVVGFLEFTKGSYVYNGQLYYMKDLGHVFFMKNNGNGTYDLRDSEIATGVKKSPYKVIGDIVSWFSIYGPRYIGWSSSCDGRDYISEGGIMGKTTKDHENVLSVLATGGYPGKNYDYRFSDKPLSRVLVDQMLKFWMDESNNASYGLRAKLEAVNKAKSSAESDVARLRAEIVSLEARVGKADSGFIRVSDIYIKK